jgi:hypothetical protein
MWQAWETGKVRMVLVRDLMGKKLLERYERLWEDNIKIDFQRV